MFVFFGNFQKLVQGVRVSLLIHIKESGVNIL